MTSRENVDKLLRGKKAERVGLMDNPWDDTMVAWVQQGYPTVIASDHSIPPTVRYDTYRCALDVYQEHMLY